MAARALSPAPLPFRQSSQVVARGIEASDVIARAPPFNPGGSNERTGTPHRTSSAAVIFAVTAPAGPAGKPGNSELSPSPSPRIFAPLPALPMAACMAPALFRASGPSARVSLRCPNGEPSRPSTPPRRPRRSKLPQTTSRRHPVAFQMIAKKKAAPSHEGLPSGGQAPSES